MLNFLNFEYFLVLAEEKNFTRAAKKLFISQQSLSGHISSLEEELGVLLFERTVPLKLTYAGRVFREYAAAFLSERDEMLKEIGDIKDYTRGEIRIGISHTRGKVFLPRILPRFKQEYPHIQISVLEGNNQELASALKEGDIDLMIDRLPFLVEETETVRLGTEEVLLILPDALLESVFSEEKDHVLTEIEKTGRLSMLKDCPFLLNKPGNTVRSIADNMFLEEGFKPQIVMETENIETLLELCKAGMGITFYPQLFFSGRESLPLSKKLHVIRMEREDARFHLGIGYSKKRFISRATRAFIEMAGQV